MQSKLAKGCKHGVFDFWIQGQCRDEKWEVWRHCQRFLVEHKMAALVPIELRPLPRNSKCTLRLERLGWPHCDVGFAIVLLSEGWKWPLCWWIWGCLESSLALSERPLSSCSGGSLQNDPFWSKKIGFCAFYLTQYITKQRHLFLFAKLESIQQRVFLFLTLMNWNFLSSHTWLTFHGLTQRQNCRNIENLLKKIWQGKKRNLLRPMVH